MAITEIYVWPRWDVRNTSYQWTASGSGTAEYYLEVSGGGAVPNLTDPPMVEGNAIDFTQGTVGSLSASQFDWGDNDSLGFSTLYVRLADDADPDSKSTGFVKAGGNDTGTVGGSESVAFETIQYALDSVTRDNANGDRFNIKAGAADVLTAALNLTIYDNSSGLPTATAPIYFEGYTSAQGDGGIGVIDGNGTYAMINDSNLDYVHIKDIKVQDCGSATGITLDNNCSCFNVEVTDTTGGGIRVESGGHVIGCYVHNVGGTPLFARGGGSIIAFCNVCQDGRTFTTAIDMEQTGGVVCFNRVELDSSASASDGIMVQSASAVFNNSIYSNAGTGNGIMDDGTGRWQLTWFNNIIEGFSGTGGVGINTSTGSNLLGYGANILENNATDESLSGDTGFSLQDNDTPASSPYTSASTSDMSLVSGQKAGAYPGLLKGSGDTSFLDQGGIQREEPTGGSATQTSYGYFG